MTSAISLRYAATTLLGAGLCSGIWLADLAQAQVSLPAAVSRPAASQGFSPSGGAQTSWVKINNSAVRLIAGAEPVTGTASKGARRIVAGVEIRLNDGWKTYWRHPGDDGGLPPTFDWAGSRNVKSARVLYPAPERLKSVAGTAIGYTKGVLFPVEIEAVDAAQPVDVALALEYGICSNICVPAEAKLSLRVVPTLAEMPLELAASLAKVPSPIEAGAEGQLLKSAKAVLSGPAAAITFDIVVGGVGARTDLFVEAPEGVYLPVPVKAGDPVSGVQRFRIGLKDVEDVAKLPGKALRLTVTGANASSELSWVVK